MGKIYDLRSGKTLTPAEFAARLAAQPRVLLGEQHDNVKHHQAQFWLLRELAKSRPQAGLLLEMLSVEQDEKIAKLNKNMTACMHCLADFLQWNKSWNWRFYGPIVALALKQDTKLVATNLTQTEVQILMTAAQPLRGYVSTAPAVQDKIAALIRNRHGFDGKASPQQQDMIRKMVQVQQFRDRRMAEKLLQTETPSLLIAGNYHVNRRFGVPVHLTDLAAETQMITVLLDDDLNHYRAEDADYLWLLPR